MLVSFLKPLKFIRLNAASRAQRRVAPDLCNARANKVESMKSGDWMRDKRAWTRNCVNQLRQRLGQTFLAA